MADKKLIAYASVTPDHLNAKKSFRGRLDPPLDSKDYPKLKMQLMH